MQVGVDAVGGARQRDAVDQEYEQHEVRQRGCDPHDLAEGGELAVRASLCASPARPFLTEPVTPSPASCTRRPCHELHH